MTLGTFLLLVQREDHQETHVFHKDVVTLGRSRDCDIVLADRHVSRKHCRVERRDDAFWLVDEGASNPVRLRGMPTDAAELHIGESFVVGAYEVQLGIPTLDPISIDETQMGDGERSALDLTTFLQIARALNDEQDLSRLLTQIVDAAIQLAGAERGFLILGAPDGGQETTVEVARNFAQEEVLSPEFAISRTIARRVLESGVAELTTNAQEDDRFSALHSVAELRLRSILCIPIRIRGELGGVLYVDNRLQQHAFQDRERAFLMSLANHAGIAIHNARTMEDLRNRTAELQRSKARVDSLNSALQGELAEKSAALTQIRDELSTDARRSFKYDYKKIAGESRAMRQVFQLLDKYTGVSDPVLILGESGTGKELVARAIHANSERGSRVFVSENCAALPEALLESELFGYVKGAFTGAVGNKKGLFESADEGVLFLDEVGDMPLDLQKKLLRVLQEGEVRPLGSRKNVPVDVRLVTATNRNLEEMVREGDFREDLYYRLNVLPIRLPPLRERRGDLPILVRRFLDDLERSNGERVRVDSAAMELLSKHRWPGNVRELQNEVRRAAVVCEGVITVNHLSDTVRNPAPGLTADEATDTPIERGTTLPDMVQMLEEREIGKALERSDNNKSRAAEMLGVSRFTLQRKLDKYGMAASGDDAEGSAGKAADDAAEGSDATNQTSKDEDSA